MRKAFAALLLLNCTLITLLVSCIIPSENYCPDPHPKDPTFPWAPCDELEPGTGADAADAAEDAEPDAGDDAEPDAGENDAGPEAGADGG